MTRSDRRLERDGLAILAAAAGGMTDHLEIGNRLGLSRHRVSYVVGILLGRRLVDSEDSQCELTTFGWNALGEQQLTYERDLAQVALRDSNVALHRETRDHRATQAHLAECETALAKVHQQLRHLLQPGSNGDAVTEVLPVIPAGALR